MKTLLTLSLALVGFLGIGATQVEARDFHISHGDIYISGYQSCGAPIYSQRVFGGYDRWGNPIWTIQRVYNPRGYRVINRPVIRRNYYRPVRRDVRRRVRRARVNNQYGYRYGRGAPRSCGY